MKTIIETLHLDFEEKEYIIDLIEQGGEFFGVEITQNQKDTGRQISLLIEPSALSDIIKTLQNYDAKIELEVKKDKTYLSKTDKKKIESNYLRGVAIKDLAMQFDQSPELIEVTLRNKGIAIVDNKPPQYWRRRNIITRNRRK